MAIDLISYLYATTVAAGGIFGYVKSGEFHYNQCYCYLEQLKLNHQIIWL